MNSYLSLKRRRNRPESFSSILYRSCVARQVSVPEISFTVAVTGNDGAVAEKLVLVSCQALETNRPTGVQLAGADSNLRAQAISKAISKARRGVVINPCGIDSSHEMRRRIAVFSDDRFCMA